MIPGFNLDQPGERNGSATVGRRPRLRFRARAPATVAVLGALVACTPVQHGTHAPGPPLHSSLLVAEAALDAGQSTVARRLYLSLAERFDDAPEPALGLAYIDYHAGDYASAEHSFSRAAELAELAGDAPVVRAEALLGAGRTALARGDTRASRQYFLNGSEIGGGLPSHAWIANGLAVSASLDGDYAAAERHYIEALRHSSHHPRITANLVRMLVAADRIDDADGLHAGRGVAYWTDDDGPMLARLIENARRNASVHAVSTAGPPEGRLPGVGSSLALRLGAPSGGQLVRASLTTRARALMLRLADSPGQTPVATDLTTPARLTLPVGQSRRLRLGRDAASVLAATPEIADVQLLAPDLLFVVGKAIGRTSVSIVDEDGGIHEQTISVVLDLETVRAVLADKPDLRGVRVERGLRAITLTGEVASAASADRALRLVVAELPEGTPIENELRIVDSQQVNLEVQIAEVQRSITEDLGINWEAFHITGDTGLGLRIGRAFTTAATGDVPGFTRALIGGELASAAGFTSSGGRTRISGMIDALANAGLANVLARPNVTAVSGKSASFFSGGEFPLPTGFDDGVIVFEYKKYGVLLDFVPTVIDAGRIALTVRPEVSEPSLNESVQIVGVDIPVINVRRAETTVEVGDGESIVIAGLFRNASNTVEAGVPWLKDLPGLGLLFGSTSVRSNELELIVVVTARLVRPGTAPQASRASLPSGRAGGYHF